MCEICGFTDCPARCPNYNHKIIAFCEKCGERIYNDSELWVDNDGNQFCSEDCAKEYYGIQEV